MPASDDRFFKHLINIPLILPDISSKTELQVSEDLLYESLDILRIKCLVLRDKGDLECHALLTLSELLAAVDIEELCVTDLLACLPDLIDQSAAAYILVNDHSQVTGNRVILGDRFVAQTFRHMGSKCREVDLTEIDLVVCLAVFREL